MLMRFIYVLCLMCFMTKFVVAQQTGGPGGGGGGGSPPTGNCIDAGIIVISCLKPDGLISCMDITQRDWTNNPHQFDCSTTRCEPVNNKNTCLLDSNIEHNYDVPEDDFITEHPNYKGPTHPETGTWHKKAQTDYPCIIKYRCTGCKVGMSPTGFVCDKSEWVFKSVPKYVKCLVDGAPQSCP